MFHTKTSVRKHATFLALAVAVAGAGALSPVSNAATINWTGTSGTDLNWVTAGNWSGTTTPPTNDLVTDIAHFGLNDYTALQPVISAARSVSGILVDGNTTGGTALNIGGGFTLNVGSPGVTLAAGNVGNVTISAPLQIGATAATFTNASAGTLFLDGGVPGGGFNDQNYDPKFLNVVVTGSGAVAGNGNWTNDATGLTNLGAWGTWGTGANTQYLTVTTTLNGTDHNLGAYTAGTALTDVNNLTTNTNFEVGTLTNAIVADGAAVRASTIRYTGSGQTITLGIGSTLQSSGILNAGTGSLVIGSVDSTGEVVVNNNTTNHNGHYAMALNAANADIEFLAALDNVSTHEADFTLTNDGVHNVYLNAVNNTGTGNTYVEGAALRVGSTKNLSVIASNGNIYFYSVIQDNLSGPSSLTINGGAHAVSLYSGNTYSGGTTLAIGSNVSINVGPSNVGLFGADGSTVTIDGGTISNSSSSPRTLGNTYNFQVNGDFAIGGTYGLAFGPGIWTLNNTVTLTMHNATGGASFGNFAGNGGLTVVQSTAADTGAATLGGSNSFAGTLNVGDGVNAGRVALSGSSTGWNGNIVLTPTGILTLSNANALGSSTLTINGGTLAGAGTIAAGAKYFLNNDFTAAPTGTLSLGTGTVTLQHSIKITFTTANSLGLGSVVDHNGYTVSAVEAPGVAGSTLTLSGANDFNGALTVGDPGLLTTATGTATTFVMASIKGTETAGIAVVSGLPTTTGLVVGQQVTGTGITGTARIVSLTPTSVTLDQNITGAGGLQTLAFGRVVGANGAVPLVSLTGSSPIWAGTINLNPSGTLAIENAGALGNSTVNINGGTLSSLTNYGRYVLTTAPTFNVNTNFSFYAVANDALDLGVNETVNLRAPITLTFVNNSSPLTLHNVSDGGHGYGLTVQRDPLSISGGLLEFGGNNNTFTGTLSVLNGASLEVTVGGNFNRNVDIALDAAGTFGSDYNATAVIFGGLSDGPNGGGTITSGSNGLSLAFTGSGDYHFSGVISSGKNSVMMGGTGSQSFSGANSYALATTLNSGTLNLDFSGPSAAGSLTDNISPNYTGFLSDILYHNATSPGVGTGIVNPGITLSGGTLLLTGKSGTQDLQRFSTMAIGTGATTVRLNANGATSLILSTGATFNPLNNGTINFDLQNSGTQSATNGVLTTAHNVNGIIGGNVLVTPATGGIDFAVSGATEVPAGVVVGSDPGTWTNDGDNSVRFVGNLTNGTPVSFNTISAGSGITPGKLYYVVGGNGSTFKVVSTPGSSSPATNATGSSGTNTIDTQGNLSALAVHSTLVGNGSDLATDNALLAGDLTLSADTTVYTLKIANTASGTLDLGGKNLQTAGGALLFTGSADYAISNGNFRSLQSSNHIVIEQYGTGNLTISAVIAGQYGGNGYGVSLVKTGPGTLTLTGANLYGHVGLSYEALFLDQGITNINGDAALGYSGAVNFNGGTLQYQSPTVGALVDNGDITANPLTPTAPVYIYSGGATVDTNGNDIVWTKAFGGGDAGGLIGGVPTGGFTKTGAGKLTLQGQGNYAGATTVSGGTLSVATLANSGVASSIGISTYASSNLVLDGGTLQYTGLATSTDRNFTVTANGGAIDASGASNAALAFTNTSPINFSGSGAHTLTLTGSSSGANTMGLLIADATAASSPTSLAKTGAGTWVLPSANTYTGGTSISNGLLLVSNTTGSATGTGDIHMTGGTLGGAGKLSGNVIGGVGAHTIAPSAGLVGNTATNLTLGGLTTSSDTTLAFNLATPGALNVNDKITVTSANGLTLTGGHVAITHTTTGVPSLGYYKAIAYNGTLGGTLGSITMPTVVNNVSYVLDSAHDAGFIDIHRGFLGDANDDGTVNFDDFLILSQNFGQAGGWSKANFISDPTVDFNDFLVLSQHFGQSIGLSDSVATPAELAQFQAASASFFAGTGVPEPTSLALLGIGAAALLTRRRRQA